VPLAETACELMFQVIADRAEKAAVIVTTNLPFSEWSQVIPNPRLCKALIDRLTDQAHIITTGTDSYRFRRTSAQRKTGNHEREDSKALLSWASEGGPIFVSTSGPIFIVTAMQLRRSTLRLLFCTRRRSECPSLAGPGPRPDRVVRSKDKLCFGELRVWRVARTGERDICYGYCHGSMSGTPQSAKSEVLRVAIAATAWARPMAWICRSARSTERPRLRRSAARSA
jgi:hypothetical protein